MKRNMLLNKIILLHDLFALARLAGSVRVAYEYLKRDHPRDMLNGKFKNIPFTARYGDWPALREVFLYDEYGCIKQLLAGCPRPTVLDIGAHIGSFALYLLAHYPNAKVISFEPTADTQKILQRNKALNPIADWQIIHAAVWKNNEDVFIQHSESSVGNRIADTDGERTRGISPQEILNSFVPDQIDFIKMDIEGAEAQVIPASEPLLERARYLMIEIHNDRIDNGEEVLSLIKKHFPFLYRIKDRSSEKPVFLCCKAEAPHLKNWVKVLQG